MAAVGQADVVLEVFTRSLNQYHRLTNFPVRIGRGLDNDIILSDARVSAHHLEIDQQDDGQLVIRNLSNENGSRVNRQVLRDQNFVVSLDETPVKIHLGGRKARLLKADTVVGEASIRNCSGLYALFSKPAWSVILIVGTLFAFIFENYLKTVYEKESFYYLSNIVPFILVMIALTLLIAGMSRLTAQRWEVGAALSLVALIMLGPHIMGEVGHLVNYLLTSKWPQHLLLMASNFLLLPLLLYTYIRFVHHSEVIAALGVALLFSGPVMLFQAAELADRLAMSDEYSGEAEFSRELSSLDIRLAPTLSIDDFIAKISIDFPADAAPVKN